MCFSVCNERISVKFWLKSSILKRYIVSYPRGKDSVQDFIFQKRKDPEFQHETDDKWLPCFFEMTKYK